MTASYWASGMDQAATFDLFTREMPEGRNFLVSCGLESVLDYLEELHFEADDLDYLRGLGMFDGKFIGMLGELRFTGEVWAIPEGEAVFAQEPILQVTAPIIEAQLVETYLLNQIGFATVVASKAARVTLACQGRPFIEMGARRSQGADASLIAARAAVIAGAASTSNVLAGKKFGLEVAGTMAHSYVTAFASEADAFRTFARQFPENTVLLIDTFDTIEGAKIAAQVAGELAEEGIKVRAVRLDSGDLVALAVRVREILDSAGHTEIRILASGDLDEWKIGELIDTPIDGFGVGTQLSTSADAPWLGVVYKLAEDESGPKFKRSPGKETLPGRKQVFRTIREGTMISDLIAPFDASVPAGSVPVLSKVMEGGKRTQPSPSISQIKARFQATLDRLPAPLRSLDAADPYPVRVDPSLTTE